MREKLSTRPQAVLQPPRPLPPWRCPAGEDDVAVPNLVGFSAFAADWSHRSALNTQARQSLVAQGVISLLNLWTTWLNRLPRLLVAATPHPSDRALTSQLHAFMSQVPTGQSGAWLYRLNVPDFLHTLDDMPITPAGYQAVELCWTGDDPMSSVEQQRMVWESLISSGGSSSWSPSSSDSLI